MSWRPSAPWPTLALRARLLGASRAYLEKRGITEVETPTLVRYPVSDPHLANLSLVAIALPGQRLYLHTSPEYHMKRLLAAGSPDIYQFGRVYRDGELSARHQPEFTLLEWYRRGLSLDAMIDETCGLILALAAEAGVSLAVPQVWGYQDVFRNLVGIDPLSTDTSSLAARARELLGDELTAGLVQGLGEDRDGWLDLLMTHVVEPAFRGTDVVVLRGYPASQAALARLDPADLRTAERFEVFGRGLELANGYRELTDAGEQGRRFHADRAARARLGLADTEPDPELLAALAHGLPDCTGVAVGFDRLLMFLLGKTAIRDVVAFPTPGP